MGSNERDGSNSGKLIIDDMEHFVNRMHTKFWQRYRQHKSKEFTTPVVGTGSTILDGSGNGKIEIYRNVTGRHLVIGRVNIGGTNSAGVAYTPATTYTNASCYVWFQTGNPSSLDLAAVFDFLPTSPNGQVLPQVAEYSGHNAIRLKQNETYAAIVNGGPANGNVWVTMWGFLEPTTTDFD